MTISKPTDEEINESAVHLEVLTPDELVNELKRMESFIQRQDADMLNGAKLIALMRAVRGYI